MIQHEAFNYLWSSLAGGLDSNRTRRIRDYQKKRLRRVELGLSLKPYFLEASWTNATGAVGEENVASTQPVTRDLLVLDGTIRTRSGNGGDIALDFANSEFFELLMIRTGGDSRVQVSRDYLQDAFLLGPQQCGIQDVSERLGQGQPWPITWPVPVHLLPNEQLQIRSRVLSALTTTDLETFAQFRCLMIDKRSQQNDLLIADVREYINRHETQEPRYLSMFTEGSHSIVFPSGSTQRTTAKTREADDHLLVLGYASLFARSNDDNDGSHSSPTWRLQTSDGHSFSREEIDVSCFGFAGPGMFYRSFPQPLFLPKGSSLSASFNAVFPAADFDLDQNYVIFRCVTV